MRWAPMRRVRHWSEPASDRLRQLAFAGGADAFCAYGYGAWSVPTA